MKIRQGKETSRPNLFSHPHDEDFTRPISVLSSLDEPGKGQKRRSRRGIATIALVGAAACALLLALFLWLREGSAPSSAAGYAATSPSPSSGEPPAGNAQGKEFPQEPAGTAQSEPQKEGGAANPFGALTTSSAPIAKAGKPLKTTVPAKKTAAKPKDQDTDVILLEAILSPHGTTAGKSHGTAQKSD